MGSETLCRIFIFYFVACTPEGEPDDHVLCATIPIPTSAPSVSATSEFATDFRDLKVLLYWTMRVSYGMRNNL